MTAANEQIVAAFEDSCMSPEDIAQSLGFDLLAVKAVLLQNCPSYRKSAKKDDALQFTENEAEEMKGIILNIARYEEDDQSLKFKAAKFILEDKKGRLDIGKQMNTLNINVLDFNAQLKKAIEAEKRTLSVSSGKVLQLVND